MSLLRARVLVCALLTVLAVTAARAGAATLTVNTTADETTPGDRACSLREAIAAINSPGSASGDCAPAAFGANTIVLQAQRYTLGAQFPPQHDELLVAPTVTNLTISGAGEGKSTIDASALANRVFEIPAGANVTIKDLTITGGRAPAGSFGAIGNGTNGGDGQPGANGGAILNAGTLTITDAAVTNSQAGGGGGGGGVLSPAIDPAAHGGAGGPRGSGGAIFSTGALTLTGVTIAGNQSGAGGNGGPTLSRDRKSVV